MCLATLLFCFREESHIPEKNCWTYLGAADWNKYADILHKKAGLLVVTIKCNEIQ